MSSQQHDDLWLENRFLQLPQQVIDEGNVEGLIEYVEDLGEDLRVYTFALHLAVDVSLNLYHPEFVNFILSQGPNCNKSDKRGFTPLHYAVLRSNTAAAQALIKAGADVNLQVKESSIRDMYHRWAMDAQSFPLHMAITIQHSFPFLHSSQNWTKPFGGPQNLDLIKLLLSSGANCNVLDGQGLAPLHYAVWADDMSAADILLESGADINIQTLHEQATPLFCAVSTEMLLFLLSKTPDQTITEIYGNSVLFHFIERKQHKLLLTLLSDSSETDVPHNDNIVAKHVSPLECAFRQRDEMSMKILINSGCDPIKEVPTTQMQPPEVKRLINIMRRMESNPRRLFDLCRFKIRNVLKTNIRMTVSELSLPEHLRGAICLKDVAQDLNLADD